MNASLEHSCDGACAELTDFLLRLAHDLLSHLDRSGDADARRLMRGFVLCLTGGMRASTAPSILDHHAIRSAIHTVADTLRNTRVASCERRDATLEANERLLDLALCAIAAEASHYRYPNQCVEFRCDCTTSTVRFTVSYEGRSPREAEMVAVPHLSVTRARSPYRSDAAISAQVAAIAAALNGGAIETAEEDGRQAVRLVLPTHRGLQP